MFMQIKRKKFGEVARKKEKKKVYCMHCEI